jgi:MFS family permease
MLTTISATSVPGRIIPPYLADIFGHFNTFTLCAFGSGVAILALWLPFNYHQSHAGLIVFALIFGFFSGALVSLFMPCVAKLGKLETLGQRFGTFQIVVSVR